MKVWYTQTHYRYPVETIQCDIWLIQRRAFVSLTSARILACIQNLRRASLHISCGVCIQIIIIPSLLLLMWLKTLSRCKKALSFRFVRARPLYSRYSFSHKQILRIRYQWIVMRANFPIQPKTFGTFSCRRSRRLPWSLLFYMSFRWTRISPVENNIYSHLLCSQLAQTLPTIG